MGEGGPIVARGLSGVTAVRYTEQQQTLLEELFLAGAVLVGDEVRERVGLNTPIYFNLREPFHTHPGLLWKVGREFAEKIRELAGERAAPQCVVGIPYTATPLAIATARYASQNMEQPRFSWGLLRKDADAFPARPRTNNMAWVGPRDSEREHSLIDDVVASGMTKRSAAAAIGREGIALRRIVVLFDRGQGDGLRQEGFELHGIFTALGAVDYYLARGLIRTSDHSNIQQFLSTHRFDTASIANPL
jgi:orotate phosphoribosyltransferase